MTLLLKLVLVPGLIALVTMAGRRFGPRIGGWLNALPLVAGPVLFFLALEQGDQFVAQAALSTLAGLAAVAAFAVIYSWTAVARPWWVCVLVGWVAFAGLTLGLQAVQWTAGAGASRSPSPPSAWRRSCCPRCRMRRRPRPRPPGTCRSA